MGTSPTTAGTRRSATVRALALLAVGATALSAGSLGTAGTAHAGHRPPAVKVRTRVRRPHQRRRPGRPAADLAVRHGDRHPLLHAAPVPQAYNLNPLYQEGITGKGRTIVIVDSFGSPTIQHDLDVFDAAVGHPEHPRSQVVKWGNVPPFDPTDPDHDRAGPARPPWTSSRRTRSRPTRTSSLVETGGRRDRGRHRPAGDDGRREVR